MQWLVKVVLLRYCVGMLRPWFLGLIALLCSPLAAPCDTVVLKDKAAITGTILAEKRDSVAVDIGYTVLVVPRSSVANISKDDQVATPVKTSPARKAVPPAKG